MTSPINLRFGPDETFKLVQFTDLHWTNGSPDDLRTRRLMEATLDAEKPALVVLTGDVIEGAKCDAPAWSWRQAVAPMEERAIPWAAVYGNHDDEGSLNRLQLLDVQQSCSMCLTQRGPAKLSGVGNFVLKLVGEDGAKSAKKLVFLDSGSYAQPDKGKYAWVQEDQIEWFRATMNGDKAAGALVFFHIPLPEFADAWTAGNCRGSKHENICCPEHNSGLFAAMRQTGQVSGVFVGHDHVNDYEATLDGIRLCYGRGSGYGTYGRDGFARGARVILLHKENRDFETWVRPDGATGAP